MKYSQVTIPCSERLRFLRLLIMCCAIMVHISGTESLKNDEAHRTRQELPRLIRERRAIKKNGTTNPQDIAKRLKIVEDRYVLPIQRMTRLLRSEMLADRISNAKNMPKWLRKHVLRTLEQRFTSSSPKSLSYT